MSRFTILNTLIVGLKIIERKHLGDTRGFLSRIFCAEELTDAGWRKPIAQINQTFTKKRGTIRGMHYQCPPNAEMKLVTCLQGAIWDVAVDLRAGSPTFLQWHAEELSAANQRALLIPEGFAHGFQTLSNDCELVYLHSLAYTPEAEAGLNPKDSRLQITWPMAVTELSTRDDQRAMLDHNFEGVML